MKGSIQADGGSYLITSIPFDESFVILVDGKKTKTEIVNTSFLGCKLEPGNHQIEIQYQAKGARFGRIISI